MNKDDDFDVEVPVEPVDPTVLMQFSRYDNAGNVLVKIHRSDGRYDRRILKAEDVGAVMGFLAQKAVENLGDVDIQVPVPRSGARRIDA